MHKEKDRRGEVSLKVGGKQEGTLEDQRASKEKITGNTYEDFSDTKTNTTST